jgi:hypothetical protein
MTNSQLKANLTKAINSNDPTKVYMACVYAVRSWERQGYWSDNWSDFQRALDDYTTFNITLEEIN